MAASEEERHRDIAERIRKQSEEWVSGDARLAVLIKSALKDVVEHVRQSEVEQIKAKLLSIVPEYVGKWANALEHEPGYNRDAPLVVMLYRLAKYRVVLAQENTNATSK